MGPGRKPKFFFPHHGPQCTAVENIHLGAACERWPTGDSLWVLGG